MFSSLDLPWYRDSDRAQGSLVQPKAREDGIIGFPWTLACHEKTWPFVSGPMPASATPPSTMTIAIAVRGAMIPPVDAYNVPKITGPRIAVTLPTPSASPNPVARYWVGNNSLVYGYTAPHAPRLKKLTNARLTNRVESSEAVAKKYPLMPPRIRNRARVRLRPHASTRNIETRYPGNCASADTTKNVARRPTLDPTAAKTGSAKGRDKKSP